MGKVKKLIAKQSILLLLTLATSLPSNALAQSTESSLANKSLSLTRSQSVIKVDGIVSDKEWHGAAMVNDLHQTRPIQFAEPTERSEFLVTFDTDFLYIAAKLYDSEPDKIVRNQLAQGQDFDSDDQISIVLDPLRNQRSGYRFKINANGLREDAVYERADNTNEDWDGIWEAKATVNEEGWSAEIAIPFKSLNFNPGNSSWGISFTREISRKRERIAWTSFDRRVNPSSAGVAHGLTGISQGRGLDIYPSLTFKRRQQHGAEGLEESEAKPSLDVFYKITPSLTGILTLNTDFSAVDVDDQQINLTRFSLFIPEKRGFFLQDSDVFRFANLEENGTPFFSRKIGLDDDGRPVDLKVGLKVAGKVGDVNVGLLAVQQAAYDAVESSDLIVGRASLNILEESSAGVIFTSGDPTSNNTNSVIGADFNYRNSRAFRDRTVDMSAWVQKSNTEGLDENDGAYGFRLRLPSSDGLFAWYRHMTLEENFNPALGFVNRPGIRENTGGFGYSYWRESSRVQQIEASVYAGQTNSINGDLESRVLWLTPVELTLSSGEEASLSVSSNTEVLVEEFDILPGIIIPAGRYDFDRIDLKLEGAEQRRVVPELYISWGEFYTGTSIDLNASLILRASRHINIGVDFEQSDIDLPEGSFKTQLYRTRLDVAFNSQVSWLNSIQFDNVSNFLGFNSRLRWVYEAGKEMTLVLNRGFEKLDTSRYRSTNTDMALKLSYLFRF